MIITTSQLRTFQSQASTLDFSTPGSCGVEKFMEEKSVVEKSRFEMSCKLSESGHFNPCLLNLRFLAKIQTNVCGNKYLALYIVSKWRVIIGAKRMAPTHCSRTTRNKNLLPRTFSTFQHSYMILTTIIDWKKPILTGNFCKNPKFSKMKIFSLIFYNTQAKREQF